MDNLLSKLKKKEQLKDISLKKREKHPSPLQGVNKEIIYNIQKGKCHMIYQVNVHRWYPAQKQW